jgi:hypothetical protein
MNCEEIKDLSSDYLERRLTVSQVVPFREHLRICPDCRREVEELRKTVALIGSLDEIETWPDFLVQVNKKIDGGGRFHRLRNWLFVPWSIKIPLEAAALVLVSTAALYVYHRSPELQQYNVAPSQGSAKSPRVELSRQQREVGFPDLMGKLIPSPEADKLVEAQQRNAQPQPSVASGEKALEPGVDMTAEKAPPQLSARLRGDATPSDSPVASAAASKALVGKESLSRGSEVAQAHTKREAPPAASEIDEAAKKVVTGRGALGSSEMSLYRRMPPANPATPEVSDSTEKTAGAGGIARPSEGEAAPPAAPTAEAPSNRRVQTLIAPPAVKIFEVVAEDTASEGNRIKGLLPGLNGRMLSEREADDGRVLLVRLPQSREAEFYSALKRETAPDLEVAASNERILSLREEPRAREGAPIARRSTGQVESSSLEQDETVVIELRIRRKK